MAKLTQAMKDMFAAQVSFITTASKNGVPNIAPKGSTRVLDDETLIFNEGFGGTTYHNILEGSKVAIGIIDLKTADGFRILGTPEVQTSGAIYDKAADFSEKNNRPKPKAVVLIHIDEIYSLKPGPNAGKRID